MAKTFKKASSPKKTRRDPRPTRALLPERAESTLGGIPRGHHSAEFNPSGRYSGHYHFGPHGQSVVVIPTRFGKPGSPPSSPKTGEPDGAVKGGRKSVTWKEAIKHHEGKERIFRLILERARPFLADADRRRGMALTEYPRLMPAAFVSEYQVVGGKEIPFGTRKAKSPRERQPSYTHQRSYHPDAISFWEMRDIWTKDKTKREVRAPPASLPLPKDPRAILDDLYQSVNWMHNKYRIAHNDLHGRNIRIYNGLPHISDSGYGVDLKRADSVEAARGIGNDLMLLTRDFKGVLPDSVLGGKIREHLDNLDYNLEVKMLSRAYIRAMQHRKKFAYLGGVVDYI